MSQVIRREYAPGGRVIYVYEKHRHGLRSNAEKWGVNKRRKVEDKKFLFLGTGRSGSTFISSVMNFWGYDVGHERTGKHGSSTHFYHSDHHWYPMFPWEDGQAHVGERKDDFNFRNVIHVVRDPLTCIPSIMAQGLTTINWEFAEETGLLPMERMPKLERVMMYWLECNRRNEALSDVTIRLEDLEHDLPLVVNRITGLDHEMWPDTQKGRNKGSGYRKSERTTYSQLQDEGGKTLANSVQQFAKKMGY